ncbi:hypothetical protein SAMCFNEI73_Ch3551 [Sinorhizobium americanum]|uniref:Uncharacterized protein n=1 Tax=Sinorhizobium americanum TaxID=194963 RepID=A0A1L3LRU7_9HYPH|nr:hypothetical protein SAMCFNEI73_Ch3551 [Sinorhizobium americanum]
MSRPLRQRDLPHFNAASRIEAHPICKRTMSQPGKEREMNENWEFSVTCFDPHT